MLVGKAQSHVGHRRCAGTPAGVHGMGRTAKGKGQDEISEIYNFLILMVHLNKTP
jgi:hypothetical protein